MILTKEFHKHVHVINTFSVLILLTKVLGGGGLQWLWEEFRMVGVNNKYIIVAEILGGSSIHSSHGSYASELRLSEDRSTVQCRY